MLTQILAGKYSSVEVLELYAKENDEGDNFSSPPWDSPLTLFRIMVVVFSVLSVWWPNHYLDNLNTQKFEASLMLGSTLIIYLSFFAKLEYNKWSKKRKKPASNDTYGYSETLGTEASKNDDTNLSGDNKTKPEDH